ncbi:G-type lectin S-receptor-like serine threonine-kinase CES101 [Olea europaea subsp. europaea]|uniref:G-type lectin S-receptor-like serine threonine-kinase CES101 n=1 Tax=Olea europaea subsp. europaea TaxID=158383 RepID=A0A8S0S7P9_OLEEU|nr:G-type lectin S-receptor-like serine threonine-kinase CES101 [Olea europaea subsp. europaea]
MVSLGYVSRRLWGLPMTAAVDFRNCAGIIVLQQMLLCFAVDVLSLKKAAGVIVGFACGRYGSGFYLSFGGAYADTGMDTILQGQQPLRDWKSLNSTNKVHRLQFFSPGTSKNRYLGIFYNKADSKYNRAVWVANHGNPIFDTSGNIMIDTHGNLKMTHSGGNVPSVFNSAPITARNASATLLDNDNFVLSGLNPDGSVNETLSQSFDYPTDTLLPGMKLGIDFRTGHRWSLTSWISDEVPASGSFMVEIQMAQANWYYGAGEMSTGLVDRRLMDISLILIFLNYLQLAMSPLATFQMRTRST